MSTQIRASSLATCVLDFDKLLFQGKKKNGERRMMTKRKTIKTVLSPVCRAPHYESGDGVPAPRQPDWLPGK